MECDPMKKVLFGLKVKNQYK